MRIQNYQETLLGSLGIAWSAWLMGFNTYDTSPVFAPFREWHVPEVLLVVVPLLLGFGLLSPLALPFEWKRNIHLALCIFWMLVAVGIGINDITFTAVPVYATVGFLHAGIYLLVKDVGYR